MKHLYHDTVFIDQSELTNDIPFTSFSLTKKYPQNNSALLIDFKNDLKFATRCIKKLIQLKNKNINFQTVSNGKNIKYILSHYNQAILDSLIAIEIEDPKERCIFTYEKFCDELDAVWKKYNPCHFCNDLCAAAKTDKRYSKPDGCCAVTFDLILLKKGFFTKDSFYPCPHLGKTNGCTTQNSACKMFACRYIKKNNLIPLKPKQSLMYQCFFNPKQRLILSNNFFKTKEQLIDKLLEIDHTPLWYYSFRFKYLILD